MTDINGYLYSGQKRVGTLTNPLYVKFSSTTPSEFNPHKEEPVIREVIREVPIEK